jgi:hypothetical protein
VRKCDSKGGTVARRAGERTFELKKWYLQPLSHICHFTIRGCADDRGSGRGHPQWIGVCFSRRSYLAATVAGGHRFKHFHVGNALVLRRKMSRRRGERTIAMDVNVMFDSEAGRLAGAPAFLQQYGDHLFGAQCDGGRHGAWICGHRQRRRRETSNARDASRVERSRTGV